MFAFHPLLSLCHGCSNLITRGSLYSLALFPQNPGLHVIWIWLCTVHFIFPAIPLPAFNQHEIFHLNVIRLLNKYVRNITNRYKSFVWVKHKESYAQDHPLQCPSLRRLHQICPEVVIQPAQLCQKSALWSSRLLAAPWTLLWACMWGTYEAQCLAVHVCVSSVTLPQAIFLVACKADSWAHSRDGVHQLMAFRAFPRTWGFIMPGEGSH